MTAPLIRLADRIRAASADTRAVDPIRMNRAYPQSVASYFTLIHKALREGVPCIIGDNISEYYYYGSDQEHWDIKRDFPCLVPPFPSFWIEWTQPSAIRSRVHPDAIRELSTYPICGTLVVTYPPERVPNVWLQAEEANRASWSDFTAGARFVIMLTPVAFMETMFSVPCGEYWISIDAEGNVINYVAMTLGDPEWAYVIGHAAPVFIHPALLTLTFMNLRNGTLTEPALHAPEKFARAYQKRRGQELVRYRTVVVDPNRTGKPSLPQGNSGRNMPLHLVRGHIARYGGEHGKLFGRYEGVFFRPAHTRGKREEGTSVHDYAVKAPRKEGV